MSPPPAQIVNAVRAVLRGTPLPQAAADIGVEPEAIADAVEAYHAAGQAALTPETRHTWFQANIQFRSQEAAEWIAATRLAPHLIQAEATGGLAQWWFIRKSPGWRLRCHPKPGSDGLHQAMPTMLDQLSASSIIERWWPAIYEPETRAFGGPAGLTIAHSLFHADSHAVLNHIAGKADEESIGRRELSLLLCATLLRAARQDWHEQGDVWERVIQMRPLRPQPPAHHMRNLTNDIRRLLTADIASRPTDVPLAEPWYQAFQQAGQQLASAAHQGRLERGLRDVLAHHVIFHWNRIGLPAKTQAIIARAARDTALAQPTDVA